MEKRTSIIKQSQASITNSQTKIKNNNIKQELTKSVSKLKKSFKAFEDEISNKKKSNHQNTSMKGSQNKLRKSENGSINGSARKSISKQTKKRKSKLNKNLKDKVETKISAEFHRSIDLLMATFLDTPSLQFQFNIFQNSSTKPNQFTTFSIPQVYLLLTHYEKICHRSYTQHLKYYIIGTLWDQGCVQVGSVQQWKEIIKRQKQDGQGTSPLDINDMISEGLIEQKAKVLLQIDEQRKEVKGWQSSKQLLTAQLIVIFQCIEQQYHREVLTFKRLQNQISKVVFEQSNKKEQSFAQAKQVQTQNSIKNSSKKDDKSNKFLSNKQKNVQNLIHILFEQLDTLKIGSIGIQDFIETYCLQSVLKTQQPAISWADFVVQKFINNIHRYDTYSNVIENPNQERAELNKDSENIRIFIQNLFQLINRIYIPESQNMKRSQSSGFYTDHCQTYSTISLLLSRYKSMKEVLAKQFQKLSVNTIQNRNQKILIVAEMEHIKNAASSIVHSSRTQRVQDYLQFNSLREESFYQTYKNEVNVQENNEPTFRRKEISYSNKEDEKHSQKWSSLRNFNVTPNRKTKTSSHTKSTAIDKFLYPENLTPQPTEPISKLSFNVHSTISKINGDQNIRRFESRPENESVGNSYDKLLRERIETELEIIALERIKNRINYYSIIN